MMHKSLYLRDASIEDCVESKILGLEESKKRPKKDELQKPLTTISTWINQGPREKQQNLKNKNEILRSIF